MDDNSMLWFNIIHGIITALATIVLAYITYHYLKETRKIRETSQETLRVANTPDVRMFLGNINGVGTVYTIDLCIQNIGTGFAYDLKFTGDFHRIHPVASKVSLAEYGVIKDGISYLGPGKFIPILLYINYEETDLPTPPIDVKINYWDSANTEYNQKDCLDFTKLEGYPQLENQSVDNIAFYLQGINDTLRDMHEKNSQ